MALDRRLTTNLSKGELSPLIEGRPDLAAFYEGGRTIENWWLMRQGGVYRRPGLRMITEVKTSSKDTILLPFEASVADSFAVEFGDAYARFVKNKAQVKTSAGGPAVEVATPYLESLIRQVHYTQSVDVMYLFHEAVQQRRLNHLSDTSWSMNAITYSPPPTFAADTDISGGTATLTPGAVSGNGVTFIASSAVFISADKGRMIIFGASRGVITQVGPSAGAPSPNAVVIVDIIDAFPDTNPIPAGDWFLRLSPQATLDPDHKRPVGGAIRLDATIDTFRADDVGKYVIIYGGVLKITQLVNAQRVWTLVYGTLDGADQGDPPAVAAGAWSLEIAAWSPTLGYPRTGEFFQGRLAQAGTPILKTDFWLSASNDFENYGSGIFANKAIAHTIASRGADRIEWVADNVDFFVGTAGSEHRVSGSRDDEPLGGDITPMVRKIDNQGNAPMMPTVVSKRILALDRSRKKLYAIAYNMEEDGYSAFEITNGAEHIFGSGVRLGPVGFARRPDPRIYYIREDGQLVTLTYDPKEKVVGFTRIVTDGTFEAVCVIPQEAGADMVYVIVKRTIGGVVKRFIEVFEENATELSGRAWTSLQTDCAVVFDLNGVSTSVFAVPHLIGKTVDIVSDGGYRGTKVVDAAGNVTLTEPATEHVEIGIHYDSTLVTMRPSHPQTMVEGLPRKWIKIWLRIKQSLGGKINNELLQYVQETLDTLPLHTGDIQAQPDSDYGLDGYITVVQHLPYPMKILSIYGDITFGDHS